MKAEAEISVSEKANTAKRVEAQRAKAPSMAVPLAADAAKPVTPPATQLVRGRVSDAEDGLPIPGAVVTVHGSETAAYTDMNGEFVITAPTDGELAFSFIGYNTYRTPVDSKPIVNARLTPDVKSLSEVVVSGTNRPGAEAIAFQPARPESGMPQFIKTVEQRLEAVPGADRFGSGIIKLSFTVQPDGSLANVKVLKSVCAECDQAAVQAVQEAARWKPAVQNGKPVPQKMRVRIPVGKKKEK
jgi:TonB family protein